MADVKVVKHGHDLDGAIFEGAATNDTLKSISPALKDLGKDIGKGQKNTQEQLKKNNEDDKNSKDSFLGGVKGFISDAFSGIGDIASGLGALTADVYNQEANVSKTVKHLGTVLSGFGGVIGGITGKIGGFDKALSTLGGFIQGGVTALEDYSKTIDEMSRQGMAFSGDVLEMKTAAATARMSLEDYSNSMIQNRDMIAGIGGTMTQAALAFSEYSKDFYDSNEAYGEQLRRLGFSYEEINDMLIFNRKMNQMTNMEDEQARQRQMSSTMILAEEMDMISKLTGVQRKEIQDEIAEARKKAQVEATIMQQMLTGNKETQEAFSAARAQMSQYGKGVQTAFDEILAYGTVVGPEAKAQVAALGESAQELYALANAAKEGRSIEEIGDISDTFQENVVDMITDPAKLGLGRLAGLGPDVANAFGDLILSPLGQATKGMVAQMQTDGTEFKNASDVLIKIREAAQKEMDDARGEAETTGQQINQTFKDIQEALKESGVSLNNFLTGPDGLVHTGGVVKSTFKVASDAVQGFSGMLTGLLESEDTIGKATQAAKNLFGVEEETEKPTDAKSATQNQRLMEQSGVSMPGYGPGFDPYQQDREMYANIQKQAELEAKNKEELTSFLEQIETSIKLSSNSEQKKELRLAAHTLKELSEQEKDTFYNDMWPELKKLGDSGEEIVRAAMKQTDAANSAEALIEAVGMKRDDAKSILTAVTDRLEDNTGITESRTWYSSIGSKVTDLFTSTNDAFAELNTQIHTQTTVTTDFMKNRHDEVMGVVETHTTDTNTHMRNRYNQSMNLFDETIAASIQKMSANPINEIESNQLTEIRNPNVEPPVVSEAEVKKAQEQSTNNSTKIDQFTEKFLNTTTAAEEQESTNNTMIKLEESINKLTDETVKTNEILTRQNAMVDFSAQQLHKANQHLGKPSSQHLTQVG